MLKERTYSDIRKDYTKNTSLLEKIDDFFYYKALFIWKGIKMIEEFGYFIHRVIFRIKHGFWPYEWYSLSFALLEYLYPRLKYFSEHIGSYPCSFEDMESWKQKVKQITEDIKFLLDEHRFGVDDVEEWTKKDARVRAFLEEHLNSLWD